MATLKRRFRDTVQSLTGFQVGTVAVPIDIISADGTLTHPQLAELVAGNATTLHSHTISENNAVAQATKVTSAAASATISQEDLAILDVGDAVTLDDFICSKVAANPTGTQWVDAAGLVVVLGAIAGYDAAIVDNDVVVTATTRGVVGNAGMDIISTSITTANGDVAVKATASIPAADLAQVAVGDSVSFAEATFTKVASNPGATQFTNTAGLAALIGAIEGWDASVNVADIDIVAAENGVEFNGEDVVLTLVRNVVGGVDSSTGVLGELAYDASYIYICTTAGTTTAVWKKATLS